CRNEVPSGTRLCDAQASTLAALPKESPPTTESHPILGTQQLLGSALKPLARLTCLIDSAKKNGNGGLFLDSKYLADVTLRTYSALDNPERTEKIINYLREQQGLPPYSPRPEGSAQSDGGKNLDASSPPSIPAQGPGPHFTIGANGVIDFAPPAELDDAGNDIDKLRSLHGALKSAAQALLDGLAPRANHYPNLSHAARTIRDQVDKNIEDVDFAILFGQFLLFDIAEQTTRRDIENGISPPIDDAEATALRVLKTLYGPFILATKIGTELVEADERYNRTADQRRALRDAAMTISQDLKDHLEIIGPAPSEFLAQAADAIGQGPRPERTAVYGGSALKNATIVISAGAMIATMSVVGVHLAGWIATIPAGLLSFLGYEVLKRTKAHDDVAKRMAGALDEHGTRLVEWAQRLPKYTMDAYVAFMLRMESSIRVLAKDHADGPLLVDLLDWLKAHADRHKGE
ncbi:MAG: hypothetical protein P4L57_16680, partial [Rhizomicrobium sp.]|nr:hypothetical protein [Rhizomicrobium sp.]